MSFILMLRNSLTIETAEWSIMNQLTNDGWDLASSVADKYEPLLRRCSFFVTSPIIRCELTLWAIMKTLGKSSEDFDSIKIISELWTNHPIKWSGKSISDLWKKKSKFVKKEGFQIFNAIKKIVYEAKGSNALCVCNEKLLDVGIAYLRYIKMNPGDVQAFENINPFNACEGVILHYDNGFQKIEELRLH